MTLFPKVRNDFGVAVGDESMSARLQLASLLDVIEQFAVEDDRHAPVFIGDRLLAIRQADDTEPSRGQLHPTPPKEALLIRTAMDQCLGHGVDDALGHRPLSYQIYDTCNATHSVFTLYSLGLACQASVLSKLLTFLIGWAGLRKKGLTSRARSIPVSVLPDNLMHKEGIAIIGIGCRFPGGVNDAESFWKLLVEGREAVCEVPPDRWNVERFYDPEPGVAGKSIARRGGFIDGIDQFDPQFFGISPREAPYVDPQHRLLLETAWEAMEDAGIVLDLERGTDLALFVGISHNDYQIIQGSPWDSSGISPHSPTGTAHSIAANRISYCFNLRGPSVALDTACSSALTAVHMACEHIWAGHGEAALAGGVTVMITPGGFIGFSQAAMLSPDGHCKAFDASANGFVRGEGAGDGGPQTALQGHRGR